MSSLLEFRKVTIKASAVALRFVWSFGSAVRANVEFPRHGTMRCCTDTTPPSRIERPSGVFRTARKLHQWRRVAVPCRPASPMVLGGVGNCATTRRCVRPPIDVRFKEVSSNRKVN